MTAPPSTRSTFDLDLHWLSHGAADTGLADHVATCGRCREYLAQLQVLDATPEALERAIDHANERVRARRKVWPLALGGSIAMAAATALVLGRLGGVPAGTYVGAKGTPAVQIVVRRGADTAIWDGQSAVRPGDALAIRAACEGLDHVAVAAPRAGRGAWAKVVDADCLPDPAKPLPFTLTVDDEPGSERLAVVLSRVRLDEARIQAAAANTTRARDVWTVRFDIPKSVGAPR